MTKRESAALPPVPLFRAAASMRGMLERIVGGMVPPQVALVEVMTGAWVSRLVSLAAQLGIADLLASGPRSAVELAASLDANAEALNRVMLALEAHGVFDSDEGGNFRLNRYSEMLRADVDGSVRDLALMLGAPWHRQAWDHLDDAVKTGKSGCVHAHGKELFDLLEEHPDYSAQFGRAMLAVNRSDMIAIASGYDFGSAEVVCDVGGGIGALLVEILRRNPKLRGILFDLPQVTGHSAEPLKAGAVADRCTVVGGSFFESVPAGCDIYILNQVLHDWDDGRSLKILQTVRAAMKPGARLLVTEMLLRKNVPRKFPGKLLDIEMLVMTTGGRERTPEQINALMEQVQLRPSRLIPISSPFIVAEAVAP